MIENETRAKEYDSLLRLIASRRYSTIESAISSTGQDDWKYNQLTQYFLNNGYAKEQDVGVRKKKIETVINDNGYKFASNHSFLEDFIKNQQLLKDRNAKQLEEELKRKEIQSNIRKNDVGLVLSIIATILATISLAIAFFK